jgi:UPF0042 nucleotide-binding protein
LDDKVKNNVLSNAGVAEFVQSYVSVINQMLPGYLREGKKYLTVAIGCTGGRHRSVSVAREIASALDGERDGFTVSAHASHRDVGRE